MVGAILLAHHDEVAVEDPGVDHAVAAHLQSEQAVGVAEHVGGLEPALEALLGQDRRAGRDAAQDGNAGAATRGGERADAARDAAAASQVSGALEHGQVVAHPVGGFDSEGLADLADGGRVAVLERELLEEGQDLAGPIVEHRILPRD